MCLNVLPNVRELGFRNLGNFCLWNPELEIFVVESEIQEFGIRNTAQVFRNSTNNWNPESKFHEQRLESITWNPESTACGIQNPRLS